MKCEKRVFIVGKMFCTLKVPKCEIFDRSDFHDFYPIQSLWEGDFAVKIKRLKKIFRGSFGAAKFLTRMLSLIFRRDFF
jgi:hypothetical protein